MSEPLAERMRPRSLDEYVGQKHLVGEGAIIMGCITGAAGGVIRDVLLNEEPVIFRKEIYAMACVLGGLTYWGMTSLGISVYFTVIASFVIVCVIRFLAVRYHISLPKLRDEE